MHRFRLYGVSELNTLLKALNECFYDWLTDVIDQQLPFDFSIQACDEVEFAQVGWRFISHSDVSIAYSLSTHFSEQIAMKAGWSEGLSSQNNSPVWNNTIIDCIDILLEKILVISGNTSIERSGSAETRIQDIWKARGSGYLCYNIILGKESLKLVIPPNLAETLISKKSQPVKHTKASNLSDRLDAASVNSLSLELIAGNAEVSLGDLNMLAIGHVIPLDKKVNQPFKLRVVGGENIGEAYLAACNENKAIYLVGK